jgi:hypothetical protein
VTVYDYLLNFAHILKLNELNTFDYKFGFHENNQLINTYFSIEQLASIKKTMELEEFCDNVCSCHKNNCSILFEFEITGFCMVNIKFIDVNDNFL